MTSYFVTFTYDTESVPIVNAGMSLSIRHLQLFFKSLRKGHKKKTGIKYYACGEYTPDLMRPHYHALIFNMDLAVLLGKGTNEVLLRNYNQLDGEHRFQSKIWPHGHITIGDVSAGAIGYVLKYMNKPKRVPEFENDDRTREFSVMSKGIGISYVSDEMVKWHKANLLERMHIVIEDGKKISMPRYYRNKIYNEKERKRILYLNVPKMKELAREKLEAEKKMYGENYVEVSVQRDMDKVKKFHKKALENRNKI